MILKLKNLCLRILLLLAVTLGLIIVSDIVSWLLSYFFGFKQPDTLFYEGLALLILGLIRSMKGYPAGMGSGSTGPAYINSLSYIFLETTKPKDETGSYHRFFFNNEFRFRFTSIALILSGILVILISAGYFNL